MIVKSSLTSKAYLQRVYHAYISYICIRLVNILELYQTKGRLQGNKRDISDSEVFTHI